MAKHVRQFRPYLYKGELVGLRECDDPLNRLAALSLIFVSRVPSWILASAEEVVADVFREFEGYQRLFLEVPQADSLGLGEGSLYSIHISKPHRPIKPHVAAHSANLRAVPASKRHAPFIRRCFEEAYRRAQKEAFLQQKLDEDWVREYALRAIRLQSRRSFIVLRSQPKAHVSFVPNSNLVGHVSLFCEVLDLFMRNRVARQQTQFALLQRVEAVAHRLKQPMLGHVSCDAEGTHRRVLASLLKRGWEVRLSRFVYSNPSYCHDG